MRFKRRVAAHIEERIESTRTVCDGCGARVDRLPMWDQSEVTIEARIGDAYPECDTRTTFDIDVCAKCFTDKVVPALAAAGLKFRVRKAYDDEDDRAWEPEDQSPVNTAT